MKNNKLAFEKWFKKFGPFIEECYEDYKQSQNGRPELNYFQFAFAFYLETAYADSLALN